MSGLLNVGVRALQANQVALQTAGNNIANVNTPGYSRQTVVMQAVQGQFTGGGYIGNGVDIATIQRNYSAFLTRQSAMAGATSAADSTRADNLKQLEGIFGGGSTGLGAAVSDMLNAFSDVASAPTDLTARTVVLTKIDETAARMRASSTSLYDLQQGVTQSLAQKVSAINSLAQNIAEVNGQISRTQGSGQSPNDLLDKRDQLVRDLNKYVQTTSIAADDGTVGIFLGGSQALVLGTNVAPVSIVKDEFGDPLTSKLAISRNGQTMTLDEKTLGGGEVPGLLRFQNTDLAEGRNLLGRLALAVTTSMNDQHKLGLDLDGKVGGNLFTPTVFNTNNIMQLAGQTPSAASPSLSISDVTKFAASDYEVNFSTGTTGTIIRRSDGVSTAFSGVPVTFDGLTLTTAANAAAGDRFLLKPFSTSASNVTSEFSTPRALAVASPVAGTMGTTNTGSLQQVSLMARLPNPPSLTAVTLKFIGSNSYTRSDDISATVFTYTSGQAIEGTIPDLPPASPLTYSNPLAQWSLTLQGSPKAGDTFTVANSKVLAAAGTMDNKLNGGNASAMMRLRDQPTFDGAALTDGYAGLISQIGVRTQSANNAASVSGSIASSLETTRTGLSGVNLDEEAAKLLQFQQAYQASAKMIQTAQTIFDTLIRTLG